MHQRRAIATFLLALTAFVAVGGGAALLFAPDRAQARPPRAADVTRPAESEAQASATPEAATPGTATPRTATPSGPDEFVLVNNAALIARPDQPGRIVIPAIALDARVVEVGIVVEHGKPAWETAAFAVGFHRGTALPGSRGNSVLAGHISSPVSKKGDVFRRLPEVRIGDRVDVYVGERRVSYEIAEVRVVPPTAVQVLNQTEDATLTLITCYPNGVYSKRLVVVGKLAES
jgi:sortase A